jgi:REP element-mobilizing transposase RayT
MDKSLPNRRSIRLKKYDYSQPGYYFITICTEDRIHRFGDIVCGNMRLNKFGEIVTVQWDDLKNRFPNIQLDQFIIMPNHIHGIIHVGAPLAGARQSLAVARQSLTGARQSRTGTRQSRTINDNTWATGGDMRATARVAPTDTHQSRVTVGEIVGGYKSLCVHHCLQWIKSNCPTFHLGKLWQRNYWEHIVRDENELNGIRDYIRQNPQKWETDRLNGGAGNMVCSQAGEIP